MNEIQLRSIADTLTDQDMEVLIRIYMGRHLHRLLNYEGASKYYCSINMHMAHDESLAWCATGTDNKNSTSLRGPVLSITVENLLALHDMQKRNNMLLLSHSKILEGESSSSEDDDAERMPF